MRRWPSSRHFFRPVCHFDARHLVQSDLCAARSAQYDVPHGVGGGAVAIGQTQSHRVALRSVDDLRDDIPRSAGRYGLFL